MVDNASGATSMNVPLAGQATTSLSEGEKNTKDDGTNLKDELISLLGKDVVTQYYTKKLLLDKYCDKMLKRKKNLKITNCENREKYYKLVQTKVKKNRKPFMICLSASVAEVPSSSALQVLRRLESIFTSVYAAVQKLKKDSWLELQFSLVDNSKLNVCPLLDLKYLLLAKLLDESYSSKNYVRKFLRALHLKWRAKVTAIEESKDLTSLSLNGLIRNLKVHEMIIKKDSEIVKAKGERKSLALKDKKESSDEECLTSESEDDGYAMAVRDFKKFFKRRECLKPPKDKNQRAFIRGSWSDSDEEDDEKAKDEMCLVA
ncbi:hypothetical protein Tco_1483064 [Tanacetum coccineum]